MLSNVILARPMKTTCRAGPRIGGGDRTGLLTSSPVPGVRFFVESSQPLPTPDHEIASARPAAGPAACSRGAGGQRPAEHHTRATRAPPRSLRPRVCRRLRLAGCRRWHGRPRRQPAQASRRRGVGGVRLQPAAHSARYAVSMRHGRRQGAHRVARSAGAVAGSAAAGDARGAGARAGQPVHRGDQPNLRCGDRPGEQAFPPHRRRRHEPGLRLGSRCRVWCVSVQVPAQDGVLKLVGFLAHTILPPCAAFEWCRASGRRCLVW
eukprot:scaffold27043_cov101-Isochrysis_galbana.AAC.1